MIPNDTLMQRETSQAQLAQAVAERDRMIEAQWENRWVSGERVDFRWVMFLEIYMINYEIFGMIVLLLCGNL